MKRLKVVIFLMLALLVSAACHYDWIAIDDSEVIDPDQEVSFSAHILPLFSDNCIACHKGGGVSPDLTPDNAHRQISTSKYINTGSPDQSLIYRAVAPGISLPGHKTLSQSQAALLLAWISQGAKNN